MSAYVLILVVSMSSYDGGVAVNWIPFNNATACDAAAKEWNGKTLWNHRTKVEAKCHQTGGLR